MGDCSKIYSVWKKHPIGLVHLVLEICVDIKFRNRVDVLKKCLPLLEIPLGILKISLILSNNVLNRNFANLSV